jgi:hypothetical protein
MGQGTRPGLAPDAPHIMIRDPACPHEVQDGGGRGEMEMLDRLEVRAGQIAAGIADAMLAEVQLFGTGRDAALHAEVRALTRQHLDGFLVATRAGAGPPPALLAAVRDRAALRARQMVPLAAQLHSLLVAQRVILAAISGEAGGDAGSRGAALALTAKAFDYSITVITTLADAYIETVQGELAELDAARRALVDTLLAGVEARPELARRAVGLGFDAEASHVVALVAVEDPCGCEPCPVPPRWAIPAIARAAGLSQRTAFVVARGNELVAVLDPAGPCRPRQVLDRAGADIRQAHGAALRAGVGGPFTGISGFADAYHQARRALRHTSARRPVVEGPGDLLLFDELTAARDDAAELIPAATRAALSDPALRAALDAFVAADLHVATAAKALFLHPNSLRYRLKRITRYTGRDPRKVTELLELVAAARILDGHKPGTAGPGPP